MNGIEEGSNKSKVMLRWAETNDNGWTRKPISMKAGKQLQDALALGMVAVLWLSFTGCAVASAEAAPDITLNTALDRGFLGLYNLDFAGAQKDFSSWEVQHPDDPVGPVSEAAGFLFSEFNRLGVLEGQFYENDDAFTARSKLKPDPLVHDQFQAAKSAPPDTQQKTYQQSLANMSNYLSSLPNGPARVMLSPSGINAD